MPADGRVLVGIGTNDDAGVFMLDEKTALVQTVDFITPVVDDPFLFGRIAACNSLSDVYAMGGRPLTALNVVAFPTGLFSLDVLTRILEGGLSMMNEAGVSLLGGHSVDDRELKYGLSVTGVVDPSRVIRNTGLREGDVLILTKPLGTGILATALKAGMLDAVLQEPFVRSMTTLNSILPDASERFALSCCTDITGFGLAGHLKEMLGDSKVEIILHADEVPILPGALENSERGMNPGGLYRNRDFAAPICSIDPGVNRARADSLFDPQTSGGLCISLPEKHSGELLSFLADAGLAEARVIASVGKSNEGIIRIVP